MFGAQLNQLKWIFRNTPYLSGFSFIMFIVSMILAITRDEFPFLLNISLFSFFNLWVFIKEYRIIRQLESLQIQIHKFNKIKGMINITTFGIWEIIVIFFAGSRHSLILIFPLLIVIMLIQTLSIKYSEKDAIVLNQYGLGHGYRKFIDEDKLFAKSIPCSVYIKSRMVFRNRGKGYVQIDWILENGNTKKWYLNLENPDVISYVSNLIDQPRTTLVNAIPVLTQHDKTYVSENIRNIITPHKFTVNRED